jgi:hypothetical protein
VPEFLRYYGTAGINASLGMGDLTDLEYAAQRTVAGWTTQVPAWVPLLGVMLVAVAVAWRRRRCVGTGGAPQSRLSGRAGGSANRHPARPSGAPGTIGPRGPRP